MPAELTHFIGGKHVNGISGRFGDVFQPMWDKWSAGDRKGAVEAIPDSVALAIAVSAARPLIGRVEVLEANTLSRANTASVFFVTSALMARSSNTASMIRSQPARSS